MSDVRFVRMIVDPLIMKLRQELYGSGVAFGKYILEGLVPTTIPRNDDVVTIVESDGFIRGITTYSGNTLIASDQTEISFSGAHVSSVGNRTYVRITPGGGGGGGSPLTVEEQDGSPSVTSTVKIVFSGATVTDNGGGEALVQVTPGFTNPLTVAGQLMYHDGAIANAALSIGPSGHVLTSLSGLPSWQPPTLSYVTFSESDGSPSFNATQIIVPPNSLQMSGASAAKLGFPRTVGWYIDGGFAAVSDIGPNIFVDVPCTITGIRLYAKTAPSGGSVDVDVQLSSNNGVSYTTIFSTRPVITAGNKVGGANAVFSTTTVTTGQILRFDIVSANNARSLTASLFMVTY